MAVRAFSASARIWLRSGQAAVVSTMRRADALIVDHDVAHHAQFDDAAPQLGVLDGGERVPHVFVGHWSSRG